MYCKIYNQSKLKTFLISIFFLLLISSCNDIKKKNEEKPSDNVRAVNIQTAGTMKTVKPQSGLNDSKSSGYAKNQIIIKFANGTDPKTISVIQKELHLEILRTFSSPNLFLMKITDNSPVKDIQKSLSKYKEVKYSEPNYKMSIDNRKGGKP